MIKEKHQIWTSLVKPIPDKEFIENIDTIPFLNLDFTFKERFNYIEEFNKILKLKINSYVNVSLLKDKYIINGISESIYHWFNYKGSIGIVPNDYIFYKKLSLNKNLTIFNPLTNLNNCDKVIISCPFSFNGSTNWQQDLIYKCADLDIPIFLDLAYLGLTDKFYLDISKNKKISVAYSMSKHYGLSFDRIGILWSSIPYEDLHILNQVGYVNISGIKKSLNLLKNYDLDHIYKKYKNKYCEIIKNLNLQSTNCILFGHKDDEKFCITEFYVC